MTAEGNRPRPANPDEWTEAGTGWVNAVSASQEDVDEVMTDLNRISAEIKAEITSLDKRMARTGKPLTCPHFGKRSPRLTRSRHRSKATGLRSDRRLASTADRWG